MTALLSSQKAAPLAILRIKRKRNDDQHPEALVVEQTKRRKSNKGGGQGLFQYAATVTDSTWNDEQLRQELQNRLASQSGDLDSALEFRTRITSSNSAPDAPQMSQSSSSRSIRYTIVDRDSPNTSLSSQVPPKVYSSKELAAKQDVKVYDAVALEDAVEAVDPEMDSFNQLLQDYLRVHDDDPMSPAAISRANSTSGPANTKPGVVEADEYVWDIFYHRPMSLSPEEWLAIANTGIVSGMPASPDDYESESESEVEDELDEDSNAEDFYRNDYPEEEGSEDSDMFHDAPSDGEEPGDDGFPDW